MNPKPLNIESAEFEALATIGQNFATAVDFIKSHDLAAIEAGRHEVDCDNVFFMVVDTDLRPVEDCALEVHDVYYDLQLPLSVAEGFGVAPRISCTKPRGEMDTNSDIMFYDDAITEIVTVNPGEALVLDPDTAHAPLVGKGATHKVIFKIKK